MKALILAGGFGTRLRPLSCTRPKILFPIVNKPLLHRVLERLANNMIEEVILAVDLQTEAFIKQHEIPRLGLQISYSRDPLKKPLGTGGAIRRAEKHLDHHDPSLVLNGDILADINYGELLKKHKEKHATATIALHAVDNPSRYGVPELTKEKRIKRFIEKPAPNTAPTNLINAGIYVLSPQIFSHLPKERKVSIEREVFPKLSEKGKVYGYIFDGFWMDMGTTEAYLKINKALLDTLPNQQRYTWENEVEFEKPVALDRGVSIGEKSVVGPYVVLGRNVVVGENVNMQNSVVFPGTEISDFSSVNGAVIGEKVVIGKGVTIGEGCVLGDHVKVKDDVSLVRGVHVCPAKEISESVLTAKNII